MELRCNVLDSATECKRIYRQLLALSNGDALDDVINTACNNHLNVGPCQTEVNDVTQKLKPWSYRHENRAYNKLRKALIMVRLQNGHKSKCPTHRSTVNNNTATTSWKIQHSSSHTDVIQPPFRYFDDASEYIEQYRLNRSRLHGHQSGQIDSQFNRTVHQVVPENPRPIYIDSKVFTLPPIAPAADNDRKHVTCDYMMSPHRQHYSDLTTFDIISIIKQRSNRDETKQVWFDEHGTAYLSLPTIPCIPINNQSK